MHITKERNMKTFFNTFGAVLIFLGLMVVAGSAGDCDGKCGPGNDIPTMLFLAFWGFVSMGLGLAMMMQTRRMI
jgi:hypothetical protein